MNVLIKDLHSVPFEKWDQPFPFQSIWKDRLGRSSRRSFGTFPSLTRRRWSLGNGLLSECCVHDMGNALAAGKKLGLARGTELHKSKVFEEEKKLCSSRPVSVA